MEIKILTSEQVPQAAGLARGVFDYCLRNTITDPQMVHAFEQYVHQDYLSGMIDEGHLVMWGAYEQETIVAVAAMQSEGHITMLYVHPMYQRHGIGKKLLLEMRKYAKNTYNLSMVTVNAMPSWTSQYFEHRKFRRMNVAQVPNNAYVSMQASSIQEISYEKKPLSTGAVLGTAFAALGICILIVVAGLVNLL